MKPKMSFQRMHYPLIDSTNLEAQRLIRAQTILQKTVITADYQEAGKGQYGREWQSAPENNILSSWIIRPKEIRIEDQFLISMVAALAVTSCLKDVINLDRAVIKWPNDILLKGKKICGILISNILQGQTLDYSIIGIGLNVNQLTFGEFTHATSLRAITGKELATDEILVALGSYLDQWYDQLLQSPTQIQIAYKKALMGYDSWVMAAIGNETIPVFIKDILMDGRLVLLHKETVKIYAMGECRLIYPDDSV